MPGKGYEMCAYTVAKRLISSGIVVETGEHDLGGVYRLSEEAVIVEPVAVPPFVADDDEEDVNDTVDVDDLLDHLGDDGSTDDDDEEDEDDDDEEAGGEEVEAIGEDDDEL
jgi:hypothetical protein